MDIEYKKGQCMEKKNPEKIKVRNNSISPLNLLNKIVPSSYSDSTWI